MERSIKKKINRVGKIGKIIMTILMVLVIIATVAVSLLTVAAARLPEDSASISFSGHAKIQVSRELFDALFWEELEKDLETPLTEEIKGADMNISVAGAQYSRMTLESSEDGVTIEGATEEIPYTPKDCVRGLLVLIVNLLLVLVVLFLCRAMMKEFQKCDSPFRPEIVKAMRRFGFALLPLAVSNTVTNAVWSSVLTAHTGTQISPDLGGIAAAVIVLVLAMIFGYGAELQQEADETL